MVVYADSIDAKFMNGKETASVPMREVGPVLLRGPEVDGLVRLPLATFESPLWPSVNRGAKLTRLCDGVRVVVTGERMTRSVLLVAPDVGEVMKTVHGLSAMREEMDAVVREGSRYARLADWHTQVVGNLLYIRFSLTTGDAAGHNMVTNAAEALLDFILKRFPQLAYGSISGNYCVDKKVSAVNGILGRGRSVVAEMNLTADVCRRHLRASAEQIVDLNVRKNLIGSILAGSVRSANAHYANMLLAFYLATGQDGANVVEGSQGITHAEAREGSLYFSVTLPNVIVGTVGPGMTGGFAAENLRRLGCRPTDEPGVSARRLAVLAAAAVFCGELSLMAAQTNPGELMRAHRALER